MHVSVIFATHNEGAALARSIEGVIETCANLDYEIILVDDASTDGSVENVALRFPHITVKRNAQRLGASPAKAAGGHAARGEVLVFLDGHTKPEVGAIPRLVRDIDLLEDRAIVTPTVAPLDVSRWSIDLSRAGHGYSLDLRTFQSG